MQVTRGNLNTLGIAFNAAFTQGLGQAPSQYQRVASVVPSTTKSNEYGWLGKLPGMRKWVGDRVIHGIMNHGYAIKNEPFELTVGVDRDDIEDDNIGIYTPLMQNMGESVGAQPDELTFGLLKNGISTACYDGQNFFDTDHPVINAEGKTVVQSNIDSGGNGPYWYLLSTKRAIKPIIFQNRKDPNFVSMDTETDEAVFSKKEFRYGTDCRRNVGFGFWQMAYASNKPLTAENVQAAYTAFTSRTGDHGRPLGLIPDLLVVVPALKFKAAEILTANQISGTDNVMKGVVDALDSAWLL
ncbi:Mu-like prophage major head subunit gpT family protein [Stenotrophomonas sp. PS02301]|uniref:Mu-like prophage major head subunit gpT family protein n=1 Tax=Stenotrophomonas sp. PS02301 TaxID=2991427 RepID=UPI00249C5171|nr:Mu-like prophage major head subunit gpT family protein [Stenotrophomonas sp. PS02301]